MNDNVPLSPDSTSTGSGGTSTTSSPPTCFDGSQEVSQVFSDASPQQKNDGDDDIIVSCLEDCRKSFELWRSSKFRKNFKIPDEIYWRLANFDSIAATFDNLPITFLPSSTDDVIGLVILDDKAHLDLDLQDGTIHEFPRSLLERPIKALESQVFRMLCEVVPGYDNASTTGEKNYTIDTNLDFNLSAVTQGEQNLGDSKRYWIPDIAICLFGDPCIVIEVASSQNMQNLLDRGIQWFRCKSVKLVILVKICESVYERGGARPTPAGEELLSGYDFNRRYNQETSSFMIEGAHRRFAGNLAVEGTIFWRENDTIFHHTELDRNLLDEDDVNVFNDLLQRRLRVVRQELSLPDAFDIVFDNRYLEDVLHNAYMETSYRRYTDWYGGLSTPALPRQVYD